MELRSIQHDYKNMISGVYAQADAGNVAAIKTFIEQKLFKTQDKVEIDIKQMNQLANMKHMELKGLLLAKISYTYTFQIDIQLEILNPVQNIAMETSNLLRCVGILLDNAIECLKESQEKTLHTMILSELDKVIFYVKNATTLIKIDSSIWKRNVSSKGRGLGLYNYQTILRKYNNIIKETKLQDGYFTQILIINDM